jgi:hypothetical protein
MEKTFREKVLKARQATLLTTANRADLSLSYIYSEVFDDLADLRAIKVKSETFAEKIESILMDPKSIYQIETRFQRFKTTVYNESGYILEYSTVNDKKKKNERGEISLLILAERSRLAQLVELFEEKVEERKMINYLVTTINGLDTHPLPVKKQPIDLGHYNRDLPHEEIKKELESEGSGLMIFHGVPGTGKTSYIRGLLLESNKEFLWLKPETLSNIDSESLLQIFAEYENSVVVLEDCEKLVQSRERRGGQSSEMNILLNLTDGILGDSFGLKFICTFNSGLDSIDTALLRSGRLRVKYEFKELKADRVKALSEKIGKNVPEMDMALCDIYNWDESKPVEKKQRAIGFTAY